MSSTLLVVHTKCAHSSLSLDSPADSRGPVPPPHSRGSAPCTTPGVNHLVSLVDRHESNGTERTNQEVLRHARAFVFDKRLEERWDEPLVCSVIEIHLNNSVSQETGVRPFEVKFGTHAGTYFRLPGELSLDQATSQFLRLLNVDLKTVGEIISKINAKVVKARRGAATEETINEYQPGDLSYTTSVVPTSSRHGPLKVLCQQHRNVEAQHLATGTIAWSFVGRLKLFAGD